MERRLHLSKEHDGVLSPRALISWNPSHLSEVMIKVANLNGLDLNIAVARVVLSLMALTSWWMLPNASQ
jgi:hypothetical protein